MRVLCRSAACERGWLPERSQPGLYIRAAPGHVRILFFCWSATLRSAHRTDLSGTRRLRNFGRSLRAASCRQWI